MSKKFPLEYRNTPLLADIMRTAQYNDSELINPWGTVLLCDNVWIANNGSGTISNYSLDGRKIGNSVTVNWGSATGNSTGSRPTGMVANTTNGFLVSNGVVSMPAKLIIVTQDGSINVYNPTISSTNALEIVNSPRKIFYGVEIVNSDLFVTEFRGAYIEKYNSNFQLISQFTDPDLVKAGYAPFNVHAIGCKLYVTFVKANIICPNVGVGGTTDVPGIGNGYIDVFDTNGTLLDRFASRGPLNSPWGMAELRVCKCEQEEGSSCSSIKEKKHMYRYLLVGNSGDGFINIYNLITKNWVGRLSNDNGDAIVIDKLWSIIIHCESDILYTSGADTKLHGIYGVIKNTN